PPPKQFDKDKKLHIFERLCFADTFETFLAGKFNTTKRFGLDGGEAIIPALKDAIDRASELGAHSFIIGMPHRGRLNVLANVMRKPMPLIFKEFSGTHYNIADHLKDADDDSHWGMSGDVKYHLGTSMDRTYPDGRRVHLSLVANPSHLECVNPLVVGKARAKQFYSGNTPADTKAVVPILLHGDAAFAGQGIVYETMQMAGVPDFNTGGTIHVIVNNQIGFTTNPINSRSTPYCSDLGKAFDCPIFHVNGDDPCAVASAMETAVEWRHKWGTDVIIDMICYRRNGHNELDQPHFTQPKLYQEIDKHPSTLDVFEAKLIEDGVLTKDETDEVRKFTLASYEKDFEASKTYESKESDWLASKWKGFKSPQQQSRVRETGVDLEVLKHVGKVVSTVPSDFTLHRQMKKIFAGREKTYTPLNNIARHLSPSAPMHELALPDTQAEFTARNSILSEFGVLGFELGYSLENPNSLIMWEAQFGDFVNGAQIMIDQFISAGEDKWMRQSGLTMLLPHGYDGMGAEHSSCRMERFLQSVDEDPHHIPPMHAEERMQIQRHNWQVVNCTTPANYFHCLRRQVHRDFRKPLVVIAPKNLLRNRMCTSSLEDMGPGTIFHRVIQEDDEKVISNAPNVKTLVFCTGQIYYELLSERMSQERDDIALVRLEQIAPFAFDRVAEACAQFPSASVVWAQQEPKNMGAYSYTMPRIMTATRELNGDEKRARFVGRNVSAAPATGMGAVHAKEYADILEGVFGAKE
ncbi:hypothetical protein TrRE_jg2005, partial [Triparma retinervis]